MPVADIPAPAEDEQALRAQLRETETALRAIEDQLSAAEVERDAATAIIKAVQGRSGSGVEMWRAEEQRDSADALIKALVKERRPLQDRLGRLSGYLNPIDQERRKLANVETALIAWEKLAGVLPVLDEFCHLIEEARELGRGTNREFAVPPTLDRLSRSLNRDGGGDRARIDHSILNTIAGHRALLARLRGGAQ